MKNRVTAVANKGEEYYDLLRDMYDVSEHWTYRLAVDVRINFATEDHRTFTGSTIQRECWYGPDDYWLDVSVNGLHVRFNSLRDAENWLEGNF